jgi:hypothetical protein
LLISLALVGAVLGFLWPRTGELDTVVVGGLVVLAQSLLSWAKFDVSREDVQLALFTSMVWVSICLIGAWVRFALRQVSDHYRYQARGDEPERAPTQPWGPATTLPPGSRQEQPFIQEKLAENPHAPDGGAIRNVWPTGR